MSEDIRKMIDKVKDFKQFVNEKDLLLNVGDKLSQKYGGWEYEVRTIVAIIDNIAVDNKGVKFERDYSSRNFIAIPIDWKEMANMYSYYVIK